MSNIIEDPEQLKRLKGRSSKMFVVFGVLVALALIVLAVTLWLRTD
jgi:hypothetical protein